jgi:hypothetical protein
VSPHFLVRLSGLGTIVGGFLLALFPLIHPNHDPAGFTSWLWIPAHASIHVAIILALFGLFGVFVLQLQQAGWLGFAGFVTAFVGSAALLTIAMVELFIMPFMALQFGLGEDSPPPPGIGEAMMTISVVFTIGYIVLGTSIVRAKVLPRSVGILLAVAAAYFMLCDMILSPIVDTERFWGLSFALFGAALAWLGYTLWQDLGAEGVSRRQRTPTVVASTR